MMSMSAPQIMMAFVRLLLIFDGHTLKTTAACFVLKQDAQHHCILLLSWDFRGLHSQQLVLM